ncbi:MAG: DUF2065 domain-containing protein [Pseudomonadota bacterium]
MDYPIWTVFLAAFGLWFLIEGAAYAVFPDEMKRFLDWAARLSPPDIRSSGIWTAALGAVLIYVAIRFS